VRCAITGAAALAAVAFASTPASATPSACFGIADDAWLRSGGGTLDDRVFAPRLARAGTPLRLN